MANIRPAEVCARFAATVALKRLGGLWTTPILLLLHQRTWRFGDLQRELAPISARVLTQRLRELEARGLVRREEIVATPPKIVEYSLTELGERTRPLFDALIAWGRQADRQAPA